MAPDKVVAVGFVEYRFFRVGEGGRDDLLESSPRREINGSEGVLVVSMA